MVKIRSLLIDKQKTEYRERIILILLIYLRYAPIVRQTLVQDFSCARRDV